jgi:anti-sigma B factor antagonist
VGTATVVRFPRCNLVEDDIINSIGKQLLSLVEKLGYHRLVLNFSNVHRLSSSMLGKLIGLHKRLQARQGQLTLCKVDPGLREIFETLRVARLFGIHPEEQEALQALQAHTS